VKIEAKTQALMEASAKLMELPSESSGARAKAPPEGGEAKSSNAEPMNVWSMPEFEEVKDDKK